MFPYWWFSALQKETFFKALSRGLLTMHAQFQLFLVSFIHLHLFAFGRCQLNYYFLPLSTKQLTRAHWHYTRGCVWVLLTCGRITTSNNILELNFQFSVILRWAYFKLICWKNWCTCCILFTCFYDIFLCRIICKYCIVQIMWNKYKLSNYQKIYISHFFYFLVDCKRVR